MNFMKVLAAAAVAMVLAACGGGVDGEQADDGLDTDAPALSASELSAAMHGRFETFVGRDGKFYFHLLAGNGEMVLASEGYATEGAAAAGIEAVKTNGSDEARYLQREATDGSAYFVVTARNGAILAVSEMYATASNATRAVGQVMKVVQNTSTAGAEAAAGAKFESFRGLDGRYYFHLRAANGEIVLQSQGYSSSAAATNGITAVRNNGTEQSRYSVLPAADGKFFFNLKALNNRTIARSQLYVSKDGAERGLSTVLATVGGTVRR